MSRNLMLEQSCLLLFLDLNAAGSSGSCYCISADEETGQYRYLGARLRERFGFPGLVEGWQHQGDDTKRAQ